MLRKLSLIIIIFLASGCSETFNKWSRSADNISGIDARVSYISEGKIVKTWILNNSKLTTGKDKTGRSMGYYYFWDENNNYVQLPIEGTIIEEIDD